MTPERPRWLDEEPELRALLNAVVDRFDEQPGDMRTRNTVLPASRYLPSLAINDAAADQRWSLVLQLQHLGVVEVRGGRRSPYDSAWENARLAFAPACEATLREWLNRPMAPSAMQRWQAAVMAHAESFPGDWRTLLARRIHVEGRSEDEIVRAIASLAQIDQPATLRQLSTFAFWGDSKVLDERGDLIAALFPALAVRERAIVAAVHLPARLEGVLFIENQDTYTAALAGQPAATLHHALVYLAGFRGAAARIRSPSGACLHFHGEGVAVHAGSFERWWFAQQPFEPLIAFWGDLDFSGMQILKSLRERFGDVVAWRPGYQTMLADLEASGGAFSRDMAHGQIDPGSTGCAFADARLLPAIRAHGFWHQERIEARGGGGLASAALTQIPTP